MRLSELSANDKVLELGGGSNPVCPGWTNLDYRKLPGVDIVADLNEPLPVEDGIYDGVFSSYLIEHLSWRKVRDLIKETYRVLKTGGKAVFITANLLEQAKKLVETEEWNDDLLCMLFGDQNYEGGDWVFNAHHCGFSPQYAVKLFNEAGFEVGVKVHPDCKTDMVIVATKQPLLDRYTWVRNEVGNLTRDKPDAEIADIGCFSCPVTYDMKNCTWVDLFSYEQIAEAMRIEGKTPMTPEKFVQVTSDYLPFDNKRFEVAICSEVLEHNEDPVKMLKEIKRVAKHVLITVPDEHSWSLDKKPFQNSAHLRHYTEGMLKQHLREAEIKDYSLDKLDYQGWAYFTVVADLGGVSTAKIGKPPKLGSDFFDEEYFNRNSTKSNYIYPFTWEVEGKKSMENASYIMDNFSPQSFLDIGCAKGFLVKALLASGVDAQGCDISKWAIENCESEVKGRLKIADIRDGLPYPDNSFDAVCSLNTLEHIELEYLDFIAKEMARVAKRWLYIEVPVNLHWNKSMPDYLPDINDLSHRTHIPAAHWEALFSKYLKLESSVLSEHVIEGNEHSSAKLVFSIRSTKESRVTESSNIFDDPTYWCGGLGYRPDARGVGYQDFPIHQVKINHILSKKPGRVLDVGCAMGYLVSRLRRAGVDAWGLDISQYALGQAPDDVKQFLVHGSADKLPWGDNSFDMVVTFGTLEHLPSEILLKAISEIKRVANRGIIAVTPGDDPCFDNDITHRTKQPLSWWKNQFPPEFDVRSDANEEWLNRKKLKVALLSTPVFTVPPHAYGGLELVVRDLAYVLAKYGHQVTVFAPDGSYVEGCEMAFLGPPLERVDANWMEAERKAAHKFTDRLMDSGFDMIHGHNWFGFEYSIKARRPELKVCHTHHGGLNIDWWAGTKPPWPLNLIGVSAWMQKVYVSQGFKACAVYNGIALEDYPLKAEKGERLLFVGRLDSFKRPHIAIDIAKRTGLGLDIVGGSFVHDVAYMEQIKKDCDGKQIKLYLDAPHEKKVELYQNAKAVIFPSKLGEPFGLIVPEANACGTPVIASPDGAIPETLKDGVTGFICNTIDKMVEAVSKVDQIKPEVCRARVEMQFTREKMAANYLEVYNKIITGEEW